MKNELKKSLLNKLETPLSEDFDSRFLEKLEKIQHTQRKPGVFSAWVTWSISGLATFSVLFIALNSYNSQHNHSFNHREYVESAMEIQDTFNEEITSDNTIDLTSAAADEI